MISKQNRHSYARNLADIWVLLDNAGRHCYDFLGFNNFCSLCYCEWWADERERDFLTVALFAPIISDSAAIRPSSIEMPMRWVMRDVPMTLMTHSAKEKKKNCPGTFFQCFFVDPFHESGEFDLQSRSTPFQRLAAALNLPSPPSFSSSMTAPPPLFPTPQGTIHKLCQQKVWDLGHPLSVF